KVALAYTLNSWWRNRNTFLQGRDEIIEFLKAKWARELNCRLIKELWAFRTTELPCGIAMNPNPQRAGGIALMAMRIGNLKAKAKCRWAIPISTMWKSVHRSTNFIGSLALRDRRVIQD